MFLKELKIKNFMIFQDVHIQFPENNKVIGIVAQYEDDEGRSNRAGKSTLIEAITYLLYGVSRVGSRNHKKLVNRAARDNKEGFEVQGTWILDDGEEFVISRQRDYKGQNPVVSVSGHEGAGVEISNEVIAEKLGFTLDEYLSTCFFKQGDINKFMDSTPSEKRNLLLEWLNQSRWDKRYKHTKALQKDKSVKLESYEVALKALDDIQDCDVDIELLDSKKERLKWLDNGVKLSKFNIDELNYAISDSQYQINIENQLNDLSKELHSLGDSLDKAKENQEKRQKLEEKYERYQNNKEKKVKKIDDAIKALEIKRESKEIGFKKKYEADKTEVLEEYNEEYSEVSREWDKEINELTLSENITLNLYNNAKSQFEKLGKHAGICPIINESCDRIYPDNDLERSLEHARENLRTIRANLSEAIGSKRNNLKELDEQKEFSIGKLDQDFMRNLEGLAGEFGEKIYKEEAKRKKLLVEYNDKMVVCRNELKEIPNESVEFYQDKIYRAETAVAELVSDQKPYEDLEKLNSKLNEEKVNLESLTFEFNEVSSEVKLLQYKVEEQERAKKKKENLEVCYNELKVELSTLDYILYMFSSRGIPNEYIKNSFETLEEDINYILEQLDSKLEIEFKPYKIGTTFEKNCLVCGYGFSGRQRKCPECKTAREKKRSDSIILNVHDKLEKNVSTFELDSGGGRALISFSVRLALLFLKLREQNCERPAVVLDEISAMLDGYNSSKIMSVVYNILGKEFNIPQIFVISHNQNELDMLEHRLLITRFGEYSTVGWG